ncbi:MAG: eukaryotic-like serine/threonine-protein kinase [Acidobacteriota bacterium]|jgi:serine/threonine protein kinase|nr:eukaryotic-like serine/threonine-protein kinase [Acidobacteriota bacterium]
MLAPNTLLQNRYLIVRPIGHGGMGAVYLARDQRLAHTVALKETFFTEERMRKAFEREARLLAHLRHPALPKVTDHFDEDGGQFIVMEFISGEDLEMLLAQRGEPFPVEQVLAWADELLKALAYLHSQDPPILHRDIKPANLKLTPQGEIILLDFGLAKGTAGQTSSVMTSRSVFGFTPNFAPLEQIQGTGTGPRSDLYSLAATIYYLMTETIPPDALTRITEVANGQPDPLRPAHEVNSQIPREVAEVLMKTMAHNRDHRPASAAEMRALLRAASPALNSISVGAAQAGVNEAQKVDRSEANTILPSTVIEAAPTEGIPAAVETAAAPTTLSLATQEPASKLETAPVEDAALPADAEKRVRRLPWAIAGVAALLLVAVTFGLVSNFSSDKAVGADKSAQTATKDAGSTAAPTIPISEQMIAAPDNSEIVTTLNASGVKTETRTFKSHARISKVVVTTSDGKQTASIFLINGDERALPENAIPTALEATGDELASAAGLIEEKGTPAQGAKVASRKTVPPVKASSQKTVPNLKVDHQNDPAQNQTVMPSPTSKQGSQSRAAGIENRIPLNQTSEGAKKSVTKP